MIIFILLAGLGSVYYLRKQRRAWKTDLEKITKKKGVSRNLAFVAHLRGERLRYSKEPSEATLLFEGETRKILPSMQHFN